MRSESTQLRLRAWRGSRRISIWDRDKTSRMTRARRKTKRWRRRMERRRKGNKKKRNRSTTQQQQQLDYSNSGSGSGRNLDHAGGDCCSSRRKRLDEEVGPASLPPDLLEDDADPSWLVLCAGGILMGQEGERWR